MGSEGGKTLELEVFSLLLCCSFCFLLPSVSFFVFFFSSPLLFSTTHFAQLDSLTLLSIFLYPLIFTPPLPTDRCFTAVSFFGASLSPRRKGQGLVCAGLLGRREEA